MGLTPSHRCRGTPYEQEGDIGNEGGFHLFLTAGGTVSIQGAGSEHKPAGRRTDMGDTLHLVAKAKDAN